MPSPLRDPGYREYLRYEGICCACVADYDTFLDLYPDIARPTKGCDPAHTENNGMGSKGPDSSCAPLCRIHHREYDSGRQAFEHKYGLDMRLEASRWYQEYLRWKQVNAVID